MAPDKKDKKRKAPAAAVAADSPAKKTKKVELKSSEPTKDAPKPILKKKNDAATKETKSASTVKANGAPARQVKPRKRAADFLSDNDSESEVDAADAKVESEKKKAGNKKTKTEASPAADAKKSKAKKPEVVVEASDDDEEASASEASADEGDDAEDDQTVALIKGFESSGDEDESGDEGYDASKPVPKIPDSKKTKRKLLKKQKNSEEQEEPGTVYVGRIPHGFYEHQMRAYFTQFGEITRLRLSRNRITGRSKHYAFIEFASTSVAKIVAETMDNYLMYGHILKCKFVPSEQLHPDLWRGANRRFKRTPWNRIEKKRLDKGKTREQWSERIEKEQKKRLAKLEKLKSVGYDIDLPQLKSVDEVPIQEEPKAIEGAETAEEPTKAIEAPAAKEADVEKKSDDTPKKSKKEKKAAQAAPKQDTPKQEEAKPASKKGASEQTASPATKAGAKMKKAKKTKAKA
ncbi:hypothetical protein MW887_007458 [Aspergillus wentii]|nr:hypothetical protein MW887_007458 [Aspergillus wentii]